MKRVEDDDDPVVPAETLAVPDRRCGYAVGLAVVHPRADVQRIVVIQEKDFGRLRRRGAFDRPGLVKIRQHLCPAPHRFVEPAVDDGGGLDPNHAHFFVGISMR